jgi:hypothetical protein
MLTTPWLTCFLFMIHFILTWLLIVIWMGAEAGFR